MNGSLQNVMLTANREFGLRLALFTNAVLTLADVNISGNALDGVQGTAANSVVALQRAIVVRNGGNGIAATFVAMQVHYLNQIRRSIPTNRSLCCLRPFFFLNLSSFFQIEDAVIEDNPGFGVSISSGALGCRLVRSILQRNPSGVFYDSVFALTMTDNLITGATGRNALYVLGSSTYNVVTGSIIIRNNTITRNRVQDAVVSLIPARWVPFACKKKEKKKRKKIKKNKHPK